MRVSRTALEQARVFFEKCGEQGLEGTAMLAGPAGAVTRCVIPDQIGRRTALGVSVEVTMAGKLQLAAALADDEQYHARIHSHPREAFHSEVDDRNPALTAEGALSIVVPDFGRGLRHGLSSCAIYIRRQGRWIGLDKASLGTITVVG